VGACDKARKVNTIKRLTTMAEEKNILEQAKEMLGSKMADAGNLMESAKNLVGDKDGDGDVDLDDVKAKVKEIVPNMEGVVDKAVDFVKDKLDKK
jgi:hypothetical protein